MTEGTDDQALAALGEGVDVEWPESGGPGDTEGWRDELGWRINEALTAKGWSIIQMPNNEEVREGVLAQAEQLPYEAPKKEFAADLVGEDGKGKICHLQQGPAAAFFQFYDDKISELCSSIQPWAPEGMGFSISGRSDGMVWTPFSSRREEDLLKPKPLDDDDVEDGLVMAHLNFIQRRKLCCMYLLGTEGGTISLRSKGEEEPSVELRVSTDQLLVFRCDEMTFHYEPEGEYTIYTVWAMDDPPEQNLQGVVADPFQKNALKGIIRGVGLPSGHRVMIDATHCSVGGSSNGTEENWNMYLAATDGFIYVPTSRFDTSLYFVDINQGEDFIPGRNAYHVHGGLCDDDKLQCFDAEFFDIKEAVCMWPKQRMVLETGYALLSQAGFTRQSMNGRCISVLVGDCRGDGDWFSCLVNDIRPEERNLLQFMDVNITASRLSHIFGLTGPTCSIDTACSSGLCAFTVATTAMRKPTDSQFQSFGSATPIEGAMTGGILVTTGPGVYIANCAGSMLSHDGRCFTFDGSADGYARGEGISCVYSRALADDSKKELMVACCIGAVSNQDGRSATLTAPNGPSQTACTRASLKEGGITPGEVNASECHGTGTALGDPIEIGALIGVHGADRTNGSAFGLTSSKSNIGHGEDNAGACGLFKCILMAKFSTCTANVHLRAMNSNLVHEGFPALFSTEQVDANLNSCISGVSSFGFGGSNAHAEIWAQATVGSHAVTAIQMETYDQLTITCPITMGQIDYLTGEPAIDFETYAPMHVKADVLRDPLADYGISRYAYDGNFRFRGGDDEAADGNEPMHLPVGTSIYVCGSWCGYSALEEMELTEDDIFTTTISLGTSRCESFFLCVNTNTALRIYPIVNDASPSISVKGPNDQGENQCWLIDGRDKEVPAGTKYKIYFNWGMIQKKVWWEEISGESAPQTFSHTYSVIGSWTSYQFEDLSLTAKAPNLYEGCFKINERGQNLFQIVRDHDLQQIIYPSKPNTTSTDIPVRGPDAWGAGKCWKVEGAADDIVKVQLEIGDGSVEVSIGTQVWESIPGWGRHDYFLKLTTTSECIPMTMVQPGIFQRSDIVINVYSEELEAFAEAFQIWVDADPDHCFYPAMSNSASGVNITFPPDGQPHEEKWLVRSVWPGVRFEVTFDLTAIDRRKMVMWKRLSDGNE